MHYASCWLVLFCNLSFFVRRIQEQATMYLEMLRTASNTCRLFCTCLPKVFLKHFDSFRFKGHDSPLWTPLHALYRLDENFKDIQAYLRCHVNIVLCGYSMQITFWSWKIYRLKFIVAGNPSDPVHAFLTRRQTCSISLNMSIILYVMSLTCHMPLKVCGQADDTPTAGNLSKKCQSHCWHQAIQNKLER